MTKKTNKVSSKVSNKPVVVPNNINRNGKNSMRFSKIEIKNPDTK